MIKVEGANLQPRGTRLIVELLENDKVTEGGIVIADTVAKGFSRGMVRYIGEKVTSLKVGEKVLLPENPGREIKVDSKEMRLLFEEMVEAIL